MTSVRDHAAALFEARRTRTPIAPLTESEPDMTIGTAYQVQQTFIEMLSQSEGSRVVGYKLGLTSTAMQEMLGVDEPDFSALLDSMIRPNAANIDLSRLIAPRVEAEVALLLGAELSGPGVTAEDASRAVRGAAAAIEVIDSRIIDWRIRLADTVSDLASTAVSVISPKWVPIDSWDPRLIGVVISRNGEIVATGAGAAVMGDPMAALAWLANALAEYGASLQPDWVIMTGAVHRAFEVQPNDVIRAEFDRLGPVTVRFEG